MSTFEVQRAGFYRYVALALITLILTLSTGDRATLSVAGPSMSKDLDLDPIAMGWLFSSFAWAYVIGHIPAGWVVDKFGVKYSMLGGLIIWSVATALQGSVGWFSSAFTATLALRFILGIFEAPIGPGSGRVLAAWFPSTERGVAGSIFNSAQYISLVIFTPLMGWLDHQFGWEHIFWVMGGFGLIMAILWIVFFSLPAQHASVSSAELAYIENGGGLTDLNLPNDVKANISRTDALPTGYAISQIFKSRMLVGIFIAQYGINSITWFFVSWFPSYLVKGLGFSILQAGFVAALPAVCGFIGGVSSGFVSDGLLRKTGNLSLARKLPITIGLLMSALMIGCNYTKSEYLVIGLMCAAFFGKGFGSLGWTVCADTAPKQAIGLTGGVFNAIGNSAGIVTPLVIGYILARTGSFEGALLFVGLHGLIAVFSYWVIVGKLQRIEIAPPASAHPSISTIGREVRS
ncbi:MFS transporter [Rhizobium rhizogenes]|uniref:MFS transporter n=1 Tax=Rhizobium rhizogenes TaxID=359 RepID=UPI0035ABF582